MGTRERMSTSLPRPTQTQQLRPPRPTSLMPTPHARVPTRTCGPRQMRTATWPIPTTRQAEIDHEYSEAVLHEKMHVDTHARASKNMKDECNDERKMLNDERDTLKVTRSTINKLTAVRTDGGMGAANDYTATTTQAPTWERL